MATTEGELGQFKYVHEYRRGLGHRVSWINPPPAGTRLLATFDDPVTVNRIGHAGMIEFTRESDGFEGAAFPQDLKVQA